MSALAIALAMVAVAGIVAVRHADRRSELDELKGMRRKITARRIAETVRTHGDNWWMR
jgi:hypothetical protein